MRFYYDKRHGVYLNARDLADSIQEVIDKYKDKATTPEQIKVISVLENIILAIETQRQEVLNNVR